MSIGKVFFEFNSRLTDLENPLVESELFSSLEYIPLMRDVESNVSLFSPEEVSKTSQFYLGRINRLIEQIEVKLPNEIKMIERPLKIQVKEKDDPEGSIHPLELHLLNELAYYQKRLELIIVTRKAYINNEPKIVKNIISLPPDSKLRELHKHFSPLLSEEEAILFMHYLVNLKFIPEYTFSDLGMIGEKLFGRNQDNLRKGIGSYGTYTSNKKDLDSFKKILTAIIKAVDEDYQNAG